MMTVEQRQDLLAIAGALRGAGILDFVCGWYLKAANYIDDLPIRAAFVSTNSITQGEQVGVLWSEMLRHGFHIFSAHRTFQWNNEAKGVAAVHCVIVGFAKADISPKRLFDYEDIRGEPQEVTASNINPYLVDSPDLLLPNRTKPISPVPEIGIGNKPIDGGYYLFTTEERDTFIASEPASAKWFRRWLGSDEFINGWERWCLWLGDCPPAELRQLPEAMKRVEAVRRFRLGIGPNKDGKLLKDGKQRPESTRKLADTPTRFHVENMPTGNYLVIPKVSSERRAFIPIGFMSSDTLCSDLVFIAPASLHLHFGIVTSTMHMAWVRAVCGRLESRYRYSAGIVYNNFPWPEAVDDKHRTAIEVAAQGVLDTRTKFPDSNLADLYDPLTMPPALVKAHQQLDKAVDAAYLAAEKAAGRKAPRIATDAERVAFLFQRYRSLTSLLRADKPKKTRKKKAGA
jgi:hypothetical protein